MEHFNKLLDEIFHGRFRLRWSHKRHEYHLEQKVQTGQILPPPLTDEGYDTYDDDWIRARDGYFYVMTIRTGNKMPCPVCQLPVDVPIMETRESVCPHCRFKGRDGRYVAAYFPLNHVLIEHLRSIDPLTDGPYRTQQRIRAQAKERTQRMHDEAWDQAEYRTSFDKAQVNNQPWVGSGTSPSRKDTTADTRIG